MEDHAPGPPKAGWQTLRANWKTWADGPRAQGSVGPNSPDPYAENLHGAYLARRLHDEKRTESSAQTAFVLALVSLVIAPLAIPALILTHWAAKGSQRTVALVIGWLVSVGMVVGIVAIIALGAAASNSVNDYFNSPYYRCMSNPNTTVSDCAGLSTSG